jgi:hypothetical protein
MHFDIDPRRERLNLSREEFAMILANLFLDYANNTFKQDPNNIKKVFGQVFSLIDEDRSPVILKKIIGLVFDYYTSPLERPALFDILKKFEMSDNVFDKRDAIAFAAVHGYLNDSCEKCCRDDNCYCYDATTEYRTGSMASREIRCLDCEQSAFIKILSELASGLPYWDTLKQYTLTQKDIEDGIFQSDAELKAGMEIPYLQRGDLNWMIRNAYSCVLNHASLVGDDIEKNVYIDIDRYFFMSGGEHYRDLRYRFHDFFRSLVAYSLIEFLTNNDRRRLKKCDKCGLFFVSKTVRKSKFCSDKCRLAHHNRRYILSGKAREYKKRGRMLGRYI